MARIHFIQMRLKSGLNKSTLKTPEFVHELDDVLPRVQVTPPKVLSQSRSDGASNMAARVSHALVERQR